MALCMQVYLYILLLRYLASCDDPEILLRISNDVSPLSPFKGLNLGGYINFSINMIEMFVLI